MQTSVELIAFPRIHMGLIDLGHSTRRLYGGAGFFIDAPQIRVRVEHGHRLELLESLNVDDRCRSDLDSALQRLASIHSAAVGKVSIMESPPQHVGLGTKTALILSCLKAVDVLNGIGAADSELVHVSGRGGASGIGVNGFFSGGFLVDAGHPADPSLSFRPSSSISMAGVPPVCVRLPFPLQWRVHLVLPASGSTYSGNAEADFFKRNTPVPKEDVLATLAAVYHGIVPAILEMNLPALAIALNELHSIGFKRREIEGQFASARLRKVLAHGVGLPVGLSSMGPLLYLISDSRIGSSNDAIRTICAVNDATYLGAFSGVNRGFEVRA